MATKLNWAEIEDSDASEEQQCNVEVKSEAKSQVHSQVNSETLKSQCSQPKQKELSNTNSQKFASQLIIKEENQQIENLEKIKGKLVYLFIFKINHSMFLPTIEQLDCVTKTQQERGWEVRLDKQTARIYLQQGLPNNMFPKMQLSGKNFSSKNKKRSYKAPRSQTNTQDTKSNIDKEIKSMTLTDNSDIASKDNSQIASNVSCEKPMKGTTYGTRQGKNYSKVYYTRDLYKPTKHQKPKYKTKQGSVYSEQNIKTQQKQQISQSGDEDQQIQIQQKKLKIQQQAKKKLEQKRKIKKHNQKKVEIKVPVSPKSAVKKTKNPFDAFD